MSKATRASAATGSRRSARNATEQQTRPQPLREHKDSSASDESDLSDAPELTEESDGDAESEGGETDVDDGDASGDFAGSRKRKRPATGRKGQATKKAATVKAAKPKRRKEQKRAVKTGHSKKADLDIKDDNTLFNAILDSSSAIQSNVEDWMILFQAERGEALAQLVNLCLRSCGCNESVDEDQAQDTDGILDTLEDIQEIFKRESLASYPLISRSPTYKRFGKSLADFFGRLYKSAAEADLFDDDDFLPVILGWISALSSSTLRSFRHTATFIALASMTRMNHIAHDLRKSHALAVRQRDLESKKARQDKGRIRELEMRVMSAEEDCVVVERFLEDIVSSIFVHRYRDSDPNIRADCVHELGIWMRDDPDKYLRGAYFRYLGWILSDQDGKARLTAVNAMFSLYEKGNFRSSVRHFTDLFKPRLLEMATSDVDLDVRCATLRLAAVMDAHDLFENEDLETLVMQVFSAESKVRSAAAPFVANMVAKHAEVITEHVSKPSNVTVSEFKSRALFKILAFVLTKSSSKDLHLCGDSRVSIAAAAVWEEMPDLADWKRLANFVTSADEAGDDAYTLSLNRTQEAALLDILHMSLTKSASGDSIEGEVEANLSPILGTAAQLLIRHRTDAPLIARVLMQIPLVPQQTLQDASNTDTRDTLAKEIHEHFMRHAEGELLTLAIRALAHLAPSETKAERLDAISEEVAQAIRTEAGDRDLETAALSENNVHSFHASLMRLLTLYSMRPPQSAASADISLWDIVSSLASRGRLGYSEENELVCSALKTLVANVFWQSASGSSPLETSSLVSFLRLLKSFICDELSVVTAEVKREAFDQIVHLMLFGESLTVGSDDGSARSLRETLQAELSGAQLGAPLRDVLASCITAVLEAPSSSDSPHEDAALADDESELSDLEDQAAGKIKASAPSTINVKKAHEACTALASLMRLVEFELVELGHLEVAIVHHGQVCVTFNHLIKAAIDLLRQRAASRRSVQSVCDLMETCMTTMHDAHIDGAQTASACAAVAKLFGNALVVRGSQLSIVSAVSGAPLENLHKNLALKYLARLEDQSLSRDKRQSAKLFLVFKSLSSMLTSAKPKDAIAIKLAVDRAVQNLEIDEPMTHKQSELLEAYEKRLLSVASKHAGLNEVGNVGRRNGAAEPRQSSAASAGPGSEHDVDEVAEDPNADLEMRPAEATEEDHLSAKSPTPSALIRPLPEPTEESHHILPSEQPRKRTRRA